MLRMPKDGKDEMLVVRIAASKKEDDVGGRKNLPFASRRGRVRNCGDVGAGFKPALARRGCTNSIAATHPTIHHSPP